ncbi:hypothetical protein H7U19_15345 [Hyunsoonleella sp. SJ7]|uniref:Uncharacterized protein n=1 Tax=Hyunsoonleella aquatilis TaxID=2762758 RepID=A0A923KLS9_9FLAO|nr:hypothetical protein [Hyunsoonleella aquatilis]MBC3759787.1 hypothetical protein [Hyunsoonleella aquatilis]
MDKIDKTIAYYNTKIDGILEFINSNDNLTVEQVIEKGEELSILEYKLTALEVAKEN